MNRRGTARCGHRLALPAGFTWRERPGWIAALDAEWSEALDTAELLDPRAVESQLTDASDPRGRAPIAILRVPSRPERVALRGLKRGGWLGPMLGARLAGPTRPFRELVATARLRAAGAPVPRPIFALAWRRGIAWHAVLGTGFVEGAIDAGELLARKPSRHRLCAAVRAAGRALRRFHDAGGSHPDLHLGNLLVRECGGTPEVLIIDLDGAGSDAVPGAAQRMEQLMRLHRSLHKRDLLPAAGGDRASVDFLHAYVAGDRTLRGALLAHLPAERRRLARHALLYRRPRADRRPTS